MTTVKANGVTLGVEHFGDAAAPLVLLAGGTTMLSWPDALCVALARGGRHVVRYDLRDCGTSTTVNPKAPAYKLRDLAADAAALARELDDRPAHLAGIGVGGMVAQVAALDHPDAFSALTPPPRARPPSASGTARPARSPRCRWPTSWAWCSPSSTVGRAGASACPSSQCRRSWCTVAATRSSQSATAKHSRARSPERGCSCSNGPRPRSPMRSPVRSRQRCLRSRRSRSRRQQQEAATGELYSYEATKNGANAVVYLAGLAGRGPGRRS